MALRIADGEFLCTRIYDVADTISLEQCRALIEKGGTEIRRLSLRREGSEYIQLSDPPLTLDLTPRALDIEGQRFDVKLAATLYHHGAMSISMRVPIPTGATFESLIPLADALYDGVPLDRLAMEEVERLRKLLASSFEDGHLWQQNEGYTVVFVRAFEGDPRPRAQTVLVEPCLSRLLLGEKTEAELSDTEEREVLGPHFSYTPYDLAIVEWNAAFVYEPSGSRDIPDLLEIANAQLLELRYYDEVLDGELQRLYDVVGDKRGSLVVSPYRAALRNQMQTLIELSEFLERVENALKIVGDVYLARVYEAGLKQLRITRWTEQVSRKHRLLMQTYQLLKGEIDQGRSLTLETMVVLLILFEIAMALFRAGH